MSFLISPEKAVQLVHHPDYLFFDATFLLPNMNRDAAAEYQDKHIEGAQFFDIDAIADTSSDLPHMVPNASDFTQMMQALGICKHHKLIFYDQSPFLSAARAWWLLRLFGKEDVYVLDGGLSGFIAAGGATTNQLPPPCQKGDFEASTPLAQMITFDALKQEIVEGKTPQIVDARPSGRFYGTVPEPRVGLRSGHMPGAINVPVTDILHPDTGAVLERDRLKEIFETAGFDFSRPAITSCGSGVTAAGLTLALAECGKFDIALYDGSWAEWGASDAPIICDA